METYSLTCKNCGAPLVVDKSAREATCSHCGTRIGIKPAKREPDVVILDSPKPPIRPPVQLVPAEIVKPYDPVDQRRRQEAEQLRLARHGANLLDAVTGYRSCLHLIIIMTVLGGLLTCGLCGLPGLLNWSSRKRGDQSTRVVKARSNGTDDVLETAARLITSHTRTSRELPSADQGNQMIERYRDEWDQGIRYEQNTATNFVIRSAGPDGVFDTADDRAEREYAATVRDTSQTAQPPDDLDAAIACLKTPGLYQKNAALKWLVAETPELDDSQRTAVVEAAIPLLRERAQKAQALSVLTLWAQPGDAPKLFAAAEQAQPRETDYIDAVVMQLIRLKDEASVISLLNHPSSSVRASVAVAVTDWQVSDQRLVQQCVEDLDRDGRQAAALTQLRQMDFSEAQQAEVTARVRRLLMEIESSSVGMRAYDFLEQVDAVDTPLLIKVYDSQNNPFVREPELRDRAAAALVERPDPSVFLMFASQLASRDRQAAERGSTYLKLMGPAAESYVWPYLRSEDLHERERACNLLAAIGTEKSLPHLQGLDVNGPASSHVKAAILDIQKAPRQPVEVPPDVPPQPGAPQL